jgi:hypothetical protein
MAIHIIQVLLLTAYVLFSELIFLVPAISLLPDVFCLLLCILCCFIISGACTNVILFTQKRE